MKKGTIFIFLMAVAAATAVWYFEFKREKPKEEEAASKPAFAFKEEDVSGIRITGADGKGSTIMAFEKRDNLWRMTQPVDSATDSANVGSIVFNTSTARFAKTLPAAADRLKDFGLDAPKIVLELRLKSGATHRLRFGDKDFSGGSVYTFIDDGKDIIALNSEVLTSVDKPVLEFRDRRIAVFDEESLVQVRVKNQQQTLVAGKDKAGKWLVREPAAHQDKELVTFRVFAIENASADEIIDQPTAAQRARLAKPVVEMEFTAQGGKVTKYFFAPDEKESALAGSSATPLIFKVKKALLDNLNFKISDVVKEPEKSETQTEKK